MKEKIRFYKKALPSEYLSQLAPVLKKAGLHWYEVVDALEEKFKEKGIAVYNNSDELSQTTEELTDIVFTDAPADDLK